MKKTFYLILFCTSTLFAQIDTTDWYPLNVGDKWEYYTSGYGYGIVEIIGDTVMNNDNKYFIFGEYGVDAWRFQRNDGNGKVYYYSTADGKEHLLFDFDVPNNSLWRPNFTQLWWGLQSTWTDKKNLLGISLENKRFSEVLIDSNATPIDTIWNPIVDVYPTKVTKGIGISSYLEGLEELVGAYINGVGYGTLVKVEEAELGTPNEFRLSQNYPNPFNPSTIIEYSIPSSTHISLKVYDILGNEVAELVNEQKESGRYRVNFNGENLSSGIYIVRLNYNNYYKTIKTTLIK
jgi:hypothetical protein